MIMEIRRKVLIMAVLALLAIMALSVTAEDSSAGSLSITDVEQKLNENTGDYYLFIYFNGNLSGVGEASIIETGYHSAYNVDEQNIKNRLVFIIGDEPYGSGIYTLRLVGGVEMIDTFTIAGDESEGSSSTMYIVIAVVLVVVVIAAVVLYKRNY